MQIRARLSNPSTTFDVTRDSRYDTNRGARTVAALQYPCNTHRRSTTISLQHSSRTASPCFAHHPPCAMRPSLLRLQPSLSQVAAKYQIPRGDFPEVERFRARLLDGEYVYSSTINCIATVHDRSHSSRCFHAELPRLAVPCRVVPCRLEPRCPALPTFRLCWSCVPAATTSRSSRPCALTHRTILRRWPVVSIGRCRYARRTTSLARPSSDAGGPVPRGQS